jgi:hypothetical protein
MVTIRSQMNLSYIIGKELKSYNYTGNRQFPWKFKKYIHSEEIKV